MLAPSKAYRQVGHTSPFKAFSLGRELKEKHSNQGHKEVRPEEQHER